MRDLQGMKIPHPAPSLDVPPSPSGGLHKKGNLEARNALLSQDVAKPIAMCHFREVVARKNNDLQRMATTLPWVSQHPRLRRAARPDRVARGEVPK
jgi:hypothetical protein